MSNKLVLFHRNCQDGWGAAMACKLHADWKDAEYIAVQYQEQPPEVAGKDVLIVDFSYKRPVLEVMHQQAASLYVIDHHETAEKELAGLGYCQFDMSHSGAYLTWQHLHGHVPELILYVEDRDLWNWKLHNSKEVSAALASYPRDVETWQPLLDRDGTLRLQHEGQAILRYQNQQIGAALGSWKRSPQFIQIAGETVPVLNCTSLISEICGELSQVGDGYPFAATYLMTSDGKRVFSLRTRKDSAVHVGNICRQYGGGGHPGAAGFAVPAELPLHDIWAFRHIG